MDSLDVVQEIKLELDDIALRCCKEEQYGCGYWTRVVKKALCDLGKQKKYDVNTGGCSNADEGEWMFDLTWGKGEGDRFLRLPLAVECEWRMSERDILWDFGKLVVSKADVKLFIFQQNNDDAVDRVFLRLKQSIDDFEVSLPDELYLLAGYSISGERFLYSKAPDSLLVEKGTP